MRIRTTKDVEMLDLKIKNELGIDVQKYRNEEVIEKFVELLVFPEYVITWVIRPVLITIGIFIIGFFVFDLVHIEYVLYGIIGLFLFLATGILIGLLFLIWKMKSDLGEIINYTLEIMKTAVEDLVQVNSQITEENRKDIFGLLFKGTIHIVTIPMLSKVISDKVSVVGGLVNWVVKRVLILVSDRVKFDEENLTNELTKTEEEPNALKVYSNSISSVSNSLDTIMKFTFRIAQLPLALGLVVILVALILFLYFIN